MFGVKTEEDAVGAIGTVGERGRFGKETGPKSTF